MLIGGLRSLIFACFIVANFTSSTAIANAQIILRTNDGQEFTLPVDVMKMIKFIYLMSLDLGISDGKDVNQSEPMEIDLTSAQCQPIFDVLEHSKARLLDAESESAKMTIADFDLELADRQKLENVMKQFWFPNEGAQKSLDELLDIIEVANLLITESVVNAAVSSFAMRSSLAKSRFHDELDDIKKLIIAQLKPQEFLALVQANAPAEQSKEEGSFKIALSFHYPTEKLPSGVTAKDRYKELSDVSAQFVTIPGGKYMIGSPDSEADHMSRERQHEVELSEFSIMNAAVTQYDYAMAMGKNPSRFKEVKHCPDSFREIEVDGVKIEICADHPVEKVSLDDAQAYAARRGEIDSSHTYSLPTEAQIEVAYRGGTLTAHVSGGDERDLAKYVWYSANARGQTHPVRSTQKNLMGVHRSSVWEWTKDRFSEAYEGSTGKDPSGTHRVFRGCGWRSVAAYCRSAFRYPIRHDFRDDDLGFRLVRMRKL